MRNGMFLSMPLGLVWEVKKKIAIKDGVLFLKKMSRPSHTQKELGMLLLCHSYETKNKTCKK